MTAADRQSIPVLNPDLATSLITFLDASLALSEAIEYMSPVSILPQPAEYSLVRHVALLWASAHGLERRDSIHDETRVMQLMRDGQYLIGLYIPKGCEFDPHPKPAPAPRLVVDADAMWSPASEAM